MAGSIQAITGGGSIRAGMSAQPGEDSVLKTSGGSVSLPMVPTLSVGVVASGGKVSNELSLPIVGIVTQSEIDGELNGGGPRISLKGNKVSLADL